MGELDRLNFGYAGAGEWARKIDDYSDDIAYPLKAYDVKDAEEVELEADYHEKIDDILPPDDFYDGLDVLVLSNLVSYHEMQFYHAMEHMPEDGLVVYEKALSPRYRSHENLVLNDDVEDGPDFIPTLHYWKKPAAQAAEDFVEEYDLKGIDNIEIITQEERMERPWTITPPEGGSVLDFGSHAPELPLVNFDGEFADNPLRFAKGWDMNSDIENDVISRYNEAFEASWNIEGDKFSEGATLDALVGKNFDQDRKEFLVKGVDPELGSWNLRGHYGTDDQPPRLEFHSGEMYQEWDLSDRKTAKEAVVDDFIRIVEGEKEPELTPEKHAEIIRGLDEANKEIGLYEDEEFEDWDGIPRLDYELLKRDKISNYL